MATVRTICTRALRRSGLVAQIDTPPAEDMANALDLLNEMARGWASEGMDVLVQSDYSLDVEWVFWVPPTSLESSVIAAVSYRGGWNASSNSPTLTSATGTTGHVYKATAAGSTTLDGISSWSIDDYLVFDGLAWLKGLSSKRFDGGVVAMLAQRLAGSYPGLKLSEQTLIEAESTKRSMLNAFITPPTAGFDRAIRDVPSRTLAVDWGRA